VLAEHFSGHRHVRDTLYPGLPDHPGHRIAVDQMQGFGGMVSFTLAGGENVFADVARESVQPSTETLLARAPDALLELRAVAPAGDYAANELSVWHALASIPAVRTARVHSVVGDFVVVAGPRLAEGAEAIARVLHPEAFK